MQTDEVVSATSPEKGFQYHHQGKENGKSEFLDILFASSGLVRRSMSKVKKNPDISGASFALTLSFTLGSHPASISR